MSEEDIESWFPRLRREGYSMASPATDDYNCIAFAGDDSAEKWDPDITSGRYWPNEVPRSLDVESFIRLYEFECGYVPCADGLLEPGFQKVAIFVDLNRQVTHAAKQLPSGRWASKLGDWEDIEHNTLSGLEGIYYGSVARFLKRPLPQTQPLNPT